MTVGSSSPKATRRIAALFAEKLEKRRTRGGATVLALIGNLGGGKTTFAQSFARALGLRRRLTSPTFLIVRRYKLKAKNHHFLYHVDAYRIGRTNELEVLGLGEIFRDPKNIVLIEWADRIKKSLPKGSIAVKFEHGRRPNERTLTFKTKK